MLQTQALKVYWSCLCLHLRSLHALKHHIKFSSPQTFMTRLLKLQGWVRHHDSPTGWSDVPEDKSTKVQNKCCSRGTCVWAQGGWGKWPPWVWGGWKWSLFTNSRGIVRVTSESLSRKVGPPYRRTLLWWTGKCVRVWCDELRGRSQCEEERTLRWEGNSESSTWALCHHSSLGGAKEEFGGVLRNTPLAVADFKDETVSQDKVGSRKSKEAESAFTSTWI